MLQGGRLRAVSFHGAQKVVAEYNLMGPVKAALESCVRCMAAELGPKRIRVHALSPGPLKARARTPEHRLVTIEDVGALASFLASDTASALTGNIEYIDAGHHVLA